MIRILGINYPNAHVTIERSTSSRNRKMILRFIPTAQKTFPKLLSSPTPPHNMGDTFPFKLTVVIQWALLLLSVPRVEDI
ncbi:hypothetical protein PsorP6_011618 [Peronosclerospora sorghi]|uniref:Uncharacterized protein n=1 Tax=Peronosclerospora sorghi TaxID=230839 RepID=A0ACC0WLS7_9STRA|nr:hypothetical protein PsorP6_011618 [Peronosclerospora sorghi]